MALTNLLRRYQREGAAEPCMMTLELEDWFANGSPNDNREKLVKNVAAGAYAGKLCYNSPFDQAHVVCFQPRSIQ